MATLTQQPPAAVAELLDVLPGHMPTLLFATDKGSPPLHRPPRSALRYPFWTPNTHSTLWVLAVDVDHDDAQDRYFAARNAGLPPASWFISKAANGHGQAGYVIEAVATGPNARIAPQEYAEDVRRALTNALSGDHAFGNGRMWNPFCQEQRDLNDVYLAKNNSGKLLVHSLGALSADLRAAGLWDTTTPLKTRQKAVHGRSEPAEGRNVYVFDQARLRAAGTVQQAADEANATLAVPLSEREVAGIVRSITKYEQRRGRPRGGASSMSGEERERQRERGSRGGSQNTARQVEQRKQALTKATSAASVVRSAESVGRHSQIRSLFEQGVPRKRIEEIVGCSESTVKRALRSRS